MALDAAKAVQAYQQAASGKSAPGLDAEAGEGPSFANMVEDAVGSAVQSIRKGEEMSIAAAKNEAELVDVVTAIANAEITLETVVAVRDRMISAYQQIMRMPI